MSKHTPGAASARTAGGPVAGETKPERKSDQFLPSLFAFCEEQFPKRCSACEVIFESFADYTRHSIAIGKPMPTLDLSERRACKPAFLSLVNCLCGSTLSLQCGDFRSPEYGAFIDAVARDAEAEGLSPEDVLQELRVRLRAIAVGLERMP